MGPDVLGFFPWMKNKEERERNARLYSKVFIEYPLEVVPGLSFQTSRSFCQREIYSILPQEESRNQREYPRIALSCRSSCNISRTFRSIKEGLGCN
jgi:hypothetical protein